MLSNFHRSIVLLCTARSDCEHQI